MSQTTQIKLEPKGCIFHNLGIQNENRSEFCQVEHPSEEEDTSACQSPLQTFNRRNTKSTTQSDISLMSQTTQIELEQKDCIFHNLGIQNANRLVSTQPNSALGRKKWRPSVTFTNLQQKKYVVNNPKVSSPEMWLASKLDLGTTTEATAWLLRILRVLVYAGVRSADQNCIPDGLMRRMNMYRDEVERVSGWETLRMRMATEKTTKGGRDLLRRV